MRRELAEVVGVAHAAGGFVPAGQLHLRQHHHHHHHHHLLLLQQLLSFIAPLVLAIAFLPVR